MKQITSISVGELSSMTEDMSVDLVKVVVDIRQKLVVVDAGLHSDEEQYLLENGSNQEDLWGINLCPDDYGTDDFVEFDLMINIRQKQDNRSWTVEDIEIQNTIISIIEKVVHE